MEKNVDGTVVLTLSGKMITGDGDVALREVLERQMRTGHTRVTLDLSELTHIDSAGLGEILRWHTSLTKKRGRLKLVNIPKRIRERLSLTRLLPVFEGKGPPVGQP